MFVTEPGWTGTFTRNQADGAMRNGTVAQKANSEPGDAHRDGALCTVLGSVANGIAVFYFVEWFDAPMIACGIASHRLRETFKPAIQEGRGK